MEKKKKSTHYKVTKPQTNTTLSSNTPLICLESAQYEIELLLPLANERRY